MMIQTPGACPNLLAIRVSTEEELAEQVACLCWSAPFSTQSSVSHYWQSLSKASSGASTASVLPLPWREGCSAGKVERAAEARVSFNRGHWALPCAQGSDEFRLPRSDPAQISQRGLLALWVQQNISPGTAVCWLSCLIFSIVFLKVCYWNRKGHNVLSDTDRTLWVFICKLENVFCVHLGEIWDCVY